MEYWCLLGFIRNKILGKVIRKNSIVWLQSFNMQKPPMGKHEYMIDLIILKRTWCEALGFHRLIIRHLTSSHFQEVSPGKFNVQSSRGRR